MGTAPQIKLRDERMSRALFLLEMKEYVQEFLELGRAQPRYWIPAFLGREAIRLAASVVY